MFINCVLSGGVHSQANILACLLKVLLGVTEGVFLFFFGDISKVAVTKKLIAHTNVFGVTS